MLRSIKWLFGWNTKIEEATPAVQDEETTDEDSTVETQPTNCTCTCTCKAPPKSKGSRTSEAEDDSDTYSSDENVKNQKYGGSLQKKVKLN